LRDIDRDHGPARTAKGCNPVREIHQAAGGPGRADQNHQSLADDVDVGVSVDGKTIKEWLSILEASFLIFKLPPYVENFGKRVIKSPQYYFVESGLLAYLLNIEKPEQISRDPLMGSMFENLVVVEAVKARYYRGQAANLYFYRDRHGNEIDLLHKSGSRMLGMEIKAAETWHPGFNTALNRFSEQTYPLRAKYVAYRGRPLRFEDGVEAVPYDVAGALLC